jgi:hypothetical protein
MYDAGYTHIVSIDISQVIVDRMNVIAVRKGKNLMY